MFDLDDKENLNDLEIAKQLFKKFPEINTMKQVEQSIDLFLENITKKGFFPQITIGALLTTAIVLTTMIKFMKKEPFELAPQIACYYKEQQYQLIQEKVEIIVTA